MNTYKYETDKFSDDYDESPINVWERSDGTRYDVLIHGSSDYITIAQGLSRTNAVIYREFVRIPVKLIKSQESIPSFPMRDHPMQNLNYVVPLTRNGSLVFQKMKNSENHPFGEHYKIATEFLTSYFKLFNVHQKPESQVEGIHISKKGLQGIKRMAIRSKFLKDNNRSQIEIPSKIRKFYIGCGDVRIEYHGIWMHEVNNYTTLCAREIIVKRQEFEELCNRFESKIS